MTDDVGIGGGSEEESGVEKELERSGMGSDEILEYIEENCMCCFWLYLIVFPMIRNDSQMLFQYAFLQISIKLQV